MTLQDKIRESISIIQKAERMALMYSDEGFHLAFSGGKDSQVIHELAKMAGVKFQAYFYKTSVDPQELLRFIKQDYPDVIWIRPKLTMFQLILKKKNLPTRKSRFCCEYIKEKNGLNRVVVLGLRKCESFNRNKRKVFSSTCKNGCDKNLLSPILEWSDKDVWDFLSMRGLPSCSLYQTQKRIGCIGCPMAYKHRAELERFPKIKKAYINTAQKVIERNPERALAKHFKTGEDAVNWWTSGLSLKEYKAMRDLQGNLF